MAKNHRQQAELLYLHLAAHGEFIKACAGGFKLSPADEGRFYPFFLSAKWFLQKTAELQLLQAAAPGDAVVFDESLSHKVFELSLLIQLPLSDLQVQQSENLCAHSAAPAAVLFMEDGAIVAKAAQQPALEAEELQAGRDLKRWPEDALVLIEPKANLSERNAHFGAAARWDAKQVSGRIFLANKD